VTIIHPDCKVELVNPGVTIHEVGKSSWVVKLGKRSRRMDKWENQWYSRWGLSNKCSICGADHTAMNRKINEEGRVSYDYNCPIAVHDQWPPLDHTKEGLNIWNSLDACPMKVASHHGYNKNEIAIALIQWEHNGSGKLVTPEELESFKTETWLICEEERQGWTFKRTQVKLGISYDVGNNYME
jgi:hypothetical protein